jgi:hypothetical protein
MKPFLAVSLILAGSLLASSTALDARKQPSPPVELKVGDVAPDFTLLSDQWKTVKLSDYRGKKDVFLAVYVLAFTGG